MPIQELTQELVREIIERYGQIRKLNLSTNEISRVENLEALSRLTKLNLFGNRLGPAPESLSGLSRLSCLKELDLSDNSMTTLEPLSLASASLEKLTVANNEVLEVNQVSFLASLTALTELVLTGNPLSNEPGYRRRVLDFLPSLETLDSIPRRQEEIFSDEEGSADQSVHGLFDPALAGERFLDSPPPAGMTYLSPESSDEAIQPESHAPAEHFSAEQDVAHIFQSTFGGTSHSGIGDESLSLPRSAQTDPPAQAIDLQSNAILAENSAAETDRAGDVGFDEGDGAIDVRKSIGSDENLAHCGGFIGREAARDRHSSTHHGQRSEPLVSRTSPTASGAHSAGVVRRPMRAVSGDDVHRRQAPGQLDSIFERRNHNVDQLPSTAAVDQTLGNQETDDSLRQTLSPRATTVTELRQPSPRRREPEFSLDAAFAMDASIKNAGWREVAKVVNRRGPSQASSDGTGDNNPQSNLLNTTDDALEPRAASSPRRSQVVQPSRSRTLDTDQHCLEVDDSKSLHHSSLPSVPTATIDDRDRHDPAVQQHEGNIHPVRGQQQGDSRTGEIIPGVEPGSMAANHLSASLENRPEEVGEGDVDGIWRGWMARSKQQVNEQVKESHLIELHDKRRNALEKDMRQLRWRDQANQPLARSSVGLMSRSGNIEGRDVRSSLPRGWLAVEEPSITVHARPGGVIRADSAVRQSLPTAKVGDDSELLFIERREVEKLKRENASLQRQAVAVEKRCSALVKMQQLADKALASGHASQYLVSEHKAPATPGDCREMQVAEVNANKLREDLCQNEGGGEGDAGQNDGVCTLLAMWRSEVLKLLLEKGDVVEAAAETSRKAEQDVKAEHESRARAEAEAKALTQRGLAAEAEAELLDVKLERALEDLRDNRNGRTQAEESAAQYASAVRNLHQWAQGFIGRASEGFFEGEALLARGIAKLEAFSQRVGLAATRLGVAHTLLQRKEVQLRNSRAALAADRRVWLLERRHRELAALAKMHPQAAYDSALPTSSQQWALPPTQPLLEGLRPECEAVMRALFCRVDRVGTGAVRARRLLEVFRSDCGVSELMEASVGAGRWRAALDSMEGRFCPAAYEGTSGSSLAEHEQDGEDRTVTWGEFLLFFMPSAGPSDDAYNAGLVPCVAQEGSKNNRDASSVVFNYQLRHNVHRALSEDAVAMLQMVVPRQWNAKGNLMTAGGDTRGDRGLAALSVGQLQREVRRLATERAYLLSLLREDVRLGTRRAEAVHDQYRHELRELHTRMGKMESSLEEAVRRADQERDRANSVEEEVGRLKEKVQTTECDWRRRLDAATREQAAASETSSREASRAASAARERLSRVEAERALALRENGKASVRQRALERELARIKDSIQTEARLEKEALEERIRAGEAKLTVARRERNALLAALRDIQKKGRREGTAAPYPHTQLSTAPVSMDAGERWGESTRANVVDAGQRSGDEFDAEEKSNAPVDGPSHVEITEDTSDKDGEKPRSDWVVVGQDTEASTSHGYSSSSSKQCEQGEGSRVVGCVGTQALVAARSASLAARLEMLAAQTQELLAEDSDEDDGLYSSDESTPE